MALFPVNFYSPQNRRSQLRSVVGAMVLIALLSGCSKDNPTAETGPGKAEMPAMPVSVITVQPESVPTLIETVGQTEGSKDVEVRARVSGILMQQHYTEGARVKAGAVLFTIDRTPFEIALTQAKAALAQDKANLEQTQREAGRLKPLVAEKAISSRELDNANTALQEALASQQINAAKLRDAELNLSYTKVTAPISGVTDRAQFSQGTLVTAGNQSTPLTTIHINDPIWVRFSFSESESLQLRKSKANSEVALIMADGSNYPTPGKLNFSASTVDNRTGMVEMRAEFPNPDHLLLPGQFVRVQVRVGEREAYLIPHAAVAQTEQGNMLFTVTPENTVAPRPVETDGWSGQNWVVTKGLAPDDKVIIDNLMKMRPGAAVAPHAPGEMPAGPMAGAKH